MVENRTWLAEQIAALEAMDRGQRAKIAAEADERFGEYAHQARQLRERIRELDNAGQPADTAGDQPAGGEGGQA